MRHYLSGFNLMQPIAKRRQKFHSFRNNIQARIFRQTLNGFKGELLIAHEVNLADKIEKCKLPKNEGFGASGRGCIGRSLTVAALPGYSCVK